jgi:hypothetical protein
LVYVIIQEETPSLPSTVPPRTKPVKKTPKREYAFFLWRKNLKKPSRDISPYTICPGDSLTPVFSAGKLDAPWCLAELALSSDLLMAASA